MMQNNYNNYIITRDLFTGMATFNFRVIGFFEYGVRFSHMTAFFETIYFDNAINRNDVENG